MDWIRQLNINDKYPTNKDANNKADNEVDKKTYFK